MIIKAQHSLFLVWGGILISAFLLASCGNKRLIDERIAKSEVAYFLENNPVFETADLEYGDVKFRKNTDSARIEAYQYLEKYGYITMELTKERKRFLSKDSTFTYRVFLTDKAIPYVLNKTDKRAIVKTFFYELDQNEEVAIEQTGKNRAKITVTLKRKETDFSMFATKNLASNASFIKKSYTFRFDETVGWKIAK